MSDSADQRCLASALQQPSKDLMKDWVSLGSITVHVLAYRLVVTRDQLKVIYLVCLWNMSDTYSG